VFLGDAEREEVVRVVELDGGLVLGERPLDLVGDAGEYGDDIVVPAGDERW
jgi:hypothetical protein